MIYVSGAVFVSMLVQVTHWIWCGMSRASLLLKLTVMPAMLMAFVLKYVRLTPSRKSNTKMKTNLQKCSSRRLTPTIQR